MFGRTRAAPPLMLTIAGTLALAAAASARAQAEQRMERVLVTGSSIQRVQAEGALPVETYTREQIERTGATTVNELLRSIATIDVFDQGELSSGSPTASGTAHIRMRGLHENEGAVLVLLNGRRLPVNALHDATGNGAAVDVNMIPMAAIERIDVLRDGASAIYGADAVAGVVNFITRRDYAGLEASVGYGISAEGDGEERRAGLTFGHGRGESKGFNFMVGVELFKRDPIFRKDRDISRSADFRRLGGPDARSGFSPFGNLVDPVTGIPTGQSVRPCPPEFFSGGACRYDFNADLLTAYNGADRAGLLAAGSLRLPGNLRLEGDLLASHSEDRFEGHPVPDVFFTPAGAPFFGRFMQGGPRISNRQAQLMQGSLGLHGRRGALDWSVDAGHGRSKVVKDESNFFDAARYLEATGSGAIDPTITTNDPALVESLKVTPHREALSTITFANAKVTGEFGALPGGPIAVAVGASAWREKLDDEPDALTQAGEVVGNIQQAAVSARRTVWAAFAETIVPVTRSLEAQFAVRHDRYPDEDRTSPKAAFRYVVAPQVSVRGSYSRSFRAPSLKQLFGAAEEGAADFTSDPLCAALGQPAGCTITGFVVNGSNPALRPEKGETYSLGMVVEPARGLSASVDWWRLELRDAILQPTIDQAVAAGSFGRDASGRITVETLLQNFARLRTEGVDVDLRYRRSTPVGILHLRNAATYYLDNRRFTDPAIGWENFNATYARPRWRNVLSLGLDQAPWSANLAVRSVSGFWDTDEPNADRSAVRKVASHTELDLAASYAGIDNLRIEVGVKNVGDRNPPFSVQNASSNEYTQMGFAELYTSRGRFFYATVNYRFF